MKKQALEPRTKRYPSDTERAIRDELFNLFTNCPIPKQELLLNLGLFIKRQDLSRVLFMHELYRKIIDVPGVVIEFGVRWGQNLALFESFRGMYEPFNHTRKIVGFDTFEGFPALDVKDGDALEVGDYSVTEQYEDYLARVLDYHEQESPIPHIRKYRLVKGDAGVEISRYLEENPETVVALAYFDMDIYEPTKKCLEAIRDRVTKGSVIGFDELNLHDFPGETRAVQEVLGLDRYRIVRSPISSTQSYLVVE
ncbi:MAG TPA: TylF/MycF/NovP-related O-methyltransferase [Polyangiaceae bacterium]